MIDEYLIFGGFNRDAPTYTWTIFMYDQAFADRPAAPGLRRLTGMIGAAATAFVAVLLYIFRPVGMMVDGACRRSTPASRASARGSYRAIARIVRHAKINFFPAIIRTAPRRQALLSIKSLPDLMSGRLWPRNFDFTHRRHGFRRSTCRFGFHPPTASTSSRRPPRPRPRHVAGYAPEIEARGGPSSRP